MDRAPTLMVKVETFGDRVVRLSKEHPLRVFNSEDELMRALDDGVV